MLSSFAAFFSRAFSDQKAVKKEPDVSNFVYKDSLNKNPSANKPKKAKKVSFASSVVKPAQVAAEEKVGKNFEGISHASSDRVEEKGMIRVKVTMTKAEAARFLSKCEDGGVIGFKDVASELVQFPMNRVDVVCPSSSSGSVLLRASISK